jgi:hypothetical protein
MSEWYVARNPQTAWRVYDGQAVILLAEDSTLNTLNPVGTLIWQTADGTVPMSAIVICVCEQFDVERAQAERDAAAFIDKLCRRGLLTLTESPSELR